MRFFVFASLVSLPVLIALPALPQEAAPATPPEIRAIAPDALLPPREGSQAGQDNSAETPDRAERLADLFRQLKRERSADRAEMLASRIQMIWNESGSPTIDLLMQWSRQAAGDEKFPAAFDLAEQVCVLEPDYAEVWNQRAILNYQTGRISAAMADVAKALELEPRHFPAMMGLAAMLEETGRKADAMAAYQRVLDIYPALKEAQDAVSRLADGLAGQKA